MFNVKLGYFDRLGRPIERDEWVILICDHTYSTIKQDKIGKYTVSTIWYGTDLDMDTYQDLYHTK